MIRWYLNRLKTMSLRELFFRIRQVLQARYEKYFVAGKKYSPVKFEVNSIDHTFNDNKFTILKNSVSVFGKELDFSDALLDWHTDIFSGRSFPLNFSKDINIRHDPELSAKVVWEINRLQFLNYIAINYRETGDKKHLDLFIKILDSWIDNNPYLKGVNWYSNIEVNIRLIVWYYAWQLLDADSLLKTDTAFKEFAENKWIPVIYAHCKYSHSNPSKFSSANNHLISEYAGLFVATSLWKFRESERWNRHAKAGLEKEILLQYSSRGVNKEEAAEYIQFITDFFLISYAVADKTANSFSDAYAERLHNIAKYIKDMLDMNGRFPQYGDEDDGAVLLFEQLDHPDNFRSILSSSAYIFKDPILKASGNGTDRKNLILFGDEFMKVLEALPGQEPERESAFYEEEGHFFMKKNGRVGSIYLHFDAAPLGYLSIAAHGHADALSFMLHLDGKPVNIDSGTYTYHTEPEWRDYFMGTLSHNTIRINGKNQASIAGPTMWLNHFTCKILETESNEKIDRVKASHNGYSDLGIEHIREISFDKREESFKITDTIICQNPTDYILEMPFHFHPECILSEKSDKKFMALTNGRLSIEYEIDKKLNTRIVKGQKDPEILGWYSPSFMKKEPAICLLCEEKTSENREYTTYIRLKKL